MITLNHCVTIILAGYLSFATNNKKKNITNELNLTSYES